MKPFLSIIIANYNYGRFLSEAIESVLSQSCSDYELIVCDGGSTDESVDVINRYSQHLAWWVSENDGGQSNAFNKGFARAGGKFLTWLNADDILLPNTIRNLKSAAILNPQCEWFVGGCLWLNPDLTIRRCFRPREFSEMRYRSGEVSGWGPSTFFTKRLLSAVGGVDERFGYLMDTDLWLRFAFKEGARYLPFGKYAFGLRLHPDAKMSGHNFAESSHTDKTHPKWSRIAAEKQIIQGYFPHHEAGVLKKLVSLRLIPSLQSRIDTLVYKGRGVKELKV